MGNGYYRGVTGVDEANRDLSIARGVILLPYSSRLDPDAVIIGRDPTHPTPRYKLVKLRLPGNIGTLVDPNHRYVLHPEDDKKITERGYKTPLESLRGLVAPYTEGKSRQIGKEPFAVYIKRGDVFVREDLLTNQAHMVAVLRPSIIAARTLLRNHEAIQLFKALKIT